MARALIIAVFAIIGTAIATSPGVLTLGMDKSGHGSTGTVIVEETSHGLEFVGVVGGLTPSASGKWENATWVSDTCGAAIVRSTMNGSTLASESCLLMPGGKEGKKVCGKLGAASAGAALTAFDHKDKNGISGLVVATAGSKTSSVTLYGTIQGLELSSSGGLHVHAGLSCKDAAAQGGHYLGTNKVGDPWAAGRWTSDKHGVAEVKISAVQVNISAANFTVNGANGVANHALVVHNHHGKRVACGILTTTDIVIKARTQLAFTASGHCAAAGEKEQEGTGHPLGVLLAVVMLCLCGGLAVFGIRYLSISKTGLAGSENPADKSRDVEFNELTQPDTE